MAFTLPELNYAYDALEPNIDAKTMEIHHTKHHQGYVNNLNAALEALGKNESDIVSICRNIDSYNTAVRNNGGGHYNHSLFWTIMSPNGGGLPTGEVADKINAQFGDFDTFKDEFSKAAATRFGSGWAWVCKKQDGSLCVCSTPNQDNPLMNKEETKTPILGLDVWEHAYYLNYQNRRPDYIEAFFHVIDWNQVNENYQKA